MYLQVNVEISGIYVDQGYDDSNALVLPAGKRKTKIKEENVSKVKKLSKKERKKLEQVVRQKEKKSNVSTLRFQIL